MRETHLTLPELALVAGTRAALGAGLALLLGDRLERGQRRTLGWALTLVGAVTTIPLAMQVFGNSRTTRKEWEWWTETDSLRRVPERREAVAHPN